jgi:hypothetical protein
MRDVEGAPAWKPGPQQSTRTIPQYTTSNDERLIANGTDLVCFILTLACITAVVIAVGVVLRLVLVVFG